MKRFSDGRPNLIMVHHSLTKDSGTVSWSAIEAFHKKEKGWGDVGYHFGVEKITDGSGRTDYQVMVGRPWFYQGAHCRHDGMNGKSLGICCVGNYDEQDVPGDLLDHLIYRLLKPLSVEFRIPLDGDHIRFHREHNEGKSCPGRRFRKDDILTRI